MLYRGCIVNIEKDFAIALTDNMEYLKIVKKDGLEVGKKILFIDEDIYKEKNFSYKKFAMAAVFLMLIISTALFNTINNISYGATALVSIDINPSIELQINKKSKVIRIIPLNKDAGELLTNEKLLGKPVEDVVYIIINKSKETRYIDDKKNSVLISTVILRDNINNKNIESEIEKKLEEYKQFENVNRVYVEGKKEDLKYAHKENISIGKYEAFKKIKEKDKHITIEAVKKMEVQEIIKKKSDTAKEKIKTPINQKLNNKEENRKIEKNNIDEIPKNENIEIKNIEKQPKIQQENKNKQIKIENKEYKKEIKQEIKEIRKEIKQEIKENKKEKVKKDKK